MADERAVDEIIARTTLSSVGNAQGGFGALGAALGAGLVEKMKPALVVQLRTTILDAVERGRFDSLLTATHRNGGRDLTLAAAARNAGADRLRFSGIERLEQEGNVATVGLQLHNDLLDTTLVLRMRLERGTDNWRVVAPDNLQQLLESLDNLHQRRLAVVNLERRKLISATVSVDPVRRAIRTYEYYNDDVILSAPVRNTGRDTIVAVLLSLYAGADSVDHSDLTLGTVVPIAPGGSAVATYTLDYNQFLDWHRQVRYAELRAEPWIIITRRGATSDTLFEYPNWAEYASRF